MAAAKHLGRASVRFAPALLLACVVTGCGSGAGSAGSGSSPAKDFVAEANAICARADERARALTGSGSKIKPESVGAAATLLRQTETELERLRPPAGSAAGFQRFLSLARGEIDLVSALAAAIRDRNLAAVRAATSRLNSKASNEAAQKIGLTVCAREAG